MLEVCENFVVLNMVQNVPAYNVFKKFTGNTSQRNWSVVFSQTSVAFLENNFCTPFKVIDNFPIDQYLLPNNLGVAVVLFLVNTD